MKSMRKVLAVMCSALYITGFVQAQDAEITYNTHVAQIINENCVVCHREGGIGPMQFENYEQVRPWAPLIQLKVANREMPPYAYDHGIGIQDLEGDWRPDPQNEEPGRRTSHTQTNPGSWVLPSASVQPIIFRPSD